MKQEDIDKKREVPPKNVWVGPVSDVSKATESGLGKEFVGPGEDDYGRRPKLPGRVHDETENAPTEPI